MSRSRFAAIALALAVCVAAVQAQAFTFENEMGNNPDGSPRFVDPDTQGEKMTAPGHSPTFSFRRGGPSDPYGFDNDREPPRMPSGAQIGAGDHGFGNSSRYAPR